MSDFPIENINDRPLTYSDSIITELRALRDGPLFEDLPGEIPGEKEMLTDSFINLTNQIIEGIADNPSKLWVMQQFKPYVAEFFMADTEARDHYGDHVELIMDILNIQSSDGLLAHYLS